MSKEKCQRKTESSILTGGKDFFTNNNNGKPCEVASNIRSERVVV